MRQLSIVPTKRTYPQYHIVTLAVENDVYNTFDFVELTEVALDHATIRRFGGRRVVRLGVLGCKLTFL